MLKLIYNEYQKIFCRKGTYVMLALLLIGTVGFQFLINRLTSNYYYWLPDQAYVESELEWMKETTDASDSMGQMQIAMYEAMLELEVYDVEYWSDDQSWQGEALSNAFYEFYYIVHDVDEIGYTQSEKETAQKAFDAIIDCIKTGDYSGYCHIMVDNLEPSSYSYKNYSTIIQYGLDKNPEDWRLELVDTLVDAEQTLDFYKDWNEEDYPDSYYTALEKYEIANYRMTNNIRYCVMNADASDINAIIGGEADYTYNTPFWDNVDSGSLMVTLVSIMIIVIAGGIIASEFSQGTIKFLLLNPVKRGKIYFSKYLTLLTLTAFLTAVTLGLTILSNLIFGAEGSDAVYLTFENGQVVSRSVFALTLSPYLFALVDAIVTITLAFMISSFMRSSALSIGLSVGVLLAGSTITAILAGFGFDWGRYLLFANTGLNSIMQGQSLFPHHSLSFAVGNIIVHMVVFLLIGYDGFTRKEV